MKFEFKDIKIDNNKFLIKYLVSIENYQLEISKGKISICVFYFPDLPISLRAAELVIKKYSIELKTEVNLVISENTEFYKKFEAESNFTRFVSSGGVNIYGEIVAEYSNVLFILNKKSD